ncbi:MAG: tetratricopeptide repeat protein [Buchnera aphidicola (Nurudea ibofushi)]
MKKILRRLKKNIFLLSCVLLLIVIYLNKNYFNNDLHLKNFEKNTIQNNVNNRNSINETVKFLAINKNNTDDSLKFLKLAKIYVKKNMLNNALLILKKSLLYTSDINILNMITLNIAKIQFQLNNQEQAIKTINSIYNYSWKSAKNDLLGDIFFALGYKNKAYEAWKNSLFFQDKVQLRDIINMKINNM